jgi:hypothetical protein
MSPPVRFPQVVNNKIVISFTFNNSIYDVSMQVEFLIFLFPV